MSKRKRTPADEPCLRQATIGDIRHEKRCPLGTLGCILKHEPPDPDNPTYAERLRQWNERVIAGQKKSHFTGD